jgi:hypothetical protein
VELVRASICFERNLDLSFSGHAGFAATIREERGVGGNQLNPVSLVAHGLKQNNAACATPQSTFVTIDECTEVT